MRIWNHIKFRLRLGRHYGELKSEILDIRLNKIGFNYVKELNRNSEIAVVSSIGGVASTSISNFAEKYSKFLINPLCYCSINGCFINYKLKHLQSPSLNSQNWTDLFLSDIGISGISNANISKMLLIVGDPVLAVKSIYNRNLQYEHYQNIHQKKDVSEVPRTVDEFFDIGIDLFDFKGILNNWLNESIKSQRMIIKMDSIWSKKDELCNFLEIPQFYNAYFPHYKSRTSRKDNKVNLLGVFEKYLEVYNELDSITYINAH